MSPSLTLPWNSAGTAVSSASVSAAGMFTSRRCTVDATSTAGSNARPPSSGSGPSSTDRHSSSSARRSGARAASTRPWAQRRSDVPTGGSATSCPAATWPHATARSGSRIRQETPSTTRWWATTSSTPGRSPGPKSNHTNRSTRPSVGASRSSAASSSRDATAVSAAASMSAGTSTRVTSSSASTVPAARTRSTGAPSASCSRIDRSASWWSTTAPMVRTSTSRSMSLGSVTATDWEKRSNPPPQPSTSRMIGVSGTSPTPPPGSSFRPPGPSPAVVRVATSARPATDRRSNTSRGVNTTPRALARETSWMETMLSPPSAKNDSSTPTRSRRSTSANTSAMISSRSLLAARNSRSSSSGSGSASRSSLPTGVSGILSSTTSAEGTMCAGSERPTNSVSAAVSIVAPAFGST
ncbi:hypothetical protein AIIKEEIJ_02142 [Rhodococcus sp. YH1]|nr:hypothetical protein [Rhodococcus sp. YH1]